MRKTNMRGGSLGRATAAIFVLFVGLYATSAGANGYSVDGQFAYRVARDIVEEGPTSAFQTHRDLLRRWGPGLPLVGAPFVWAGERLADLLPPANSVALSDVPGTTGPLRVPLDRLAPISRDTVNAPDDRPSLTIDIPPDTGALLAVTMVSALSYARTLPDGAVVATLTAIDGTGAPSSPSVPLRAGLESSEWSWNDRSVGPTAHRAALLAGYEDGNAAFRLARTTIRVDRWEGARLKIEAVSTVGRFHLAALVVSGARGATLLTAAPSGGSEQTRDRVTRAVFGFANVVPAALIVTTMVPIAVSYGATIPIAVVMALVLGGATLVFPYARLDFAETVATASVWCAFALRLSASTTRGSTSAALTALATLSAGFAVLTKYTTLLFVPLLAIDVIVGHVRRPDPRSSYARPVGGRWPRYLRARDLILALGIGIPIVAGLVAFAADGISSQLLTFMPIAISELPAGLARGWLGFSLWAGLTSLLLSPGRGLIVSMAPALLGIVGIPAFVRRHRWRALIPVGMIGIYLLVFAGKGGWHGGGWGPRYLVPAVPFLMLMALPVLQWAGRTTRAGRALVAIVIGAGLAVQLLAVLKHPNQYTILFRDQIGIQLPDASRVIGGPVAQTYRAYFRGDQSGSELERPPGDPTTVHGTILPRRGLGHLIDRENPLIVTLWPTETGRFALTLYFCNYDGPPDIERHQTVTIVDSRDTQSVMIEDFTSGVYASWVIDAVANDPILVAVTDSGRAFPVISGFFFDPAPTMQTRPNTVMDRTTSGNWIGTYGRDGLLLPGWEMGPRNVGTLPNYIARVTGGIPLWVDTGDAERSEAPLLYGVGFSPIAGHAWLLANDLIATVFPADLALRQRALASPPWRYLHGLEIQAQHPEYGLGVDLWPLTWERWFASDVTIVRTIWAVEAVLATVTLLGGAACAATLWRHAEVLPIGEEKGSPSDWGQ